MNQQADSLCLHCGLCCSDVLFARVELGEQSITRVCRTRWRSVSINLIERSNNSTSFVLPCGALDEQGRCRCYHERPHTCARYQCRLLQRYEAGLVSWAKALEKIELVKNHVETLSQSLADLATDEPEAAFYLRLQLFREWYQAASPEARAEVSHLMVAQRALLLILSREFYFSDSVGLR